MNDFESMIPIDLGWSGDKKFCCVDGEGRKLLLRVSPPEKREAREREFETLFRVAELDLPIGKLLRYYVRDDGVYAYYTWVEGESAETLVPQMPLPEQYAFGLRAGEILRGLHSIDAPEYVPEWKVRFSRKVNRKIEIYDACPIKYDGGDRFKAYLNDNMELFYDRPRCFQHGDYHVGNMLVNDGGIAVIDFDRMDFGDPWEEFNRISWCAQKCPAFAAGRVDGYFDGDIPLKFFKLMAYYIASNTLSSVAWAIQFGQSQIDVMVKQAQEVLVWFDNIDEPVPTWYREYGKKTVAP